MSVKVIILLATAFLLVQCSFSKSVADERVSLLWESFFQHPDIKLYRDLKNTQIAAKLLDFSGKVVQKLESGEYHDEEETAAILQSLHSNISSVENRLLQGADKISIKEWFPLTITLLNATAKCSTSDQLQFFVEAVKFVEDFGVEAQDFWDNLSYQQQKEQQIFGEFLNKYKDADAFGYKMEIFLGFVGANTYKEEVFKDSEDSEDSEEELDADYNFYFRFLMGEYAKHIDVVLKFVNEVSFYVFTDLWNEQDESISNEDRVAQIVKVSLLIKDLGTLKPQSAFSDKAQFFATWFDFLEQESTNQLAAKSLLNRNLDPKRFVLSKFSKPLLEFSKDLKKYLSSLSPEERNELEGEVDWLHEFIELGDLINLFFSFKERYSKTKKNLF